MKNTDKVKQAKNDKQVITDFDHCPNCGSDFGYYSKVRSKLKWHDNTMFDHKTKENTDMMDNLDDTWESAWYYCMECHEKICKR